MSVESVSGTTLGRYRLDALIGRGNRASVYQATPSGGGAPVAIRVFDRDLSKEPEFAERFRQRAGTLESIHHPNLLPIVDHDEYEGQAFLVRPFVAGGALRRRLGTPLPLAEVVTLLRPVAAALDHAHSYGVVHGDVKPGNILLPRPGEVILADLGIAQLLPRGNSLLMTATGRSYGTPEYLSPEQAHALTLDGRTDQYALGVIVYEALTGRPPFKAERPGDTPRAVAARHITTPPPSLRGLNPAVPEAVERVVLRALDKDPERRFPSCIALIDALVAADPVGATPTVAPVGSGVDIAIDSGIRPVEFDLPAATSILMPDDPPPTSSGPGPLERQRAQHAAEVRALSATHELQIAAQTARLRDQEATIADLTRQLAEVRADRDRLITDYAAVVRVRDELQRQARPATAERLADTVAEPVPPSAPLVVPESAPPLEESPQESRQVLGRLALLEPHLYGLPRGAQFSVRAGATIGRHPDSAIVIDEAFISAHHARITWERDRCWITDLNTKNGTYVNGARISVPTRLNPGDVLRFGRVRASFS